MGYEDCDESTGVVEGERVFIRSWGIKKRHEQGDVFLL